MQRTIVFVYNASNDLWNKSIDFAHKIISPSTYACDLCSLTHGNFSERKIWKFFRESIGHEFRFIYKDEFLKKYQDKSNQELQFPIVLEQKEAEFIVLISADELRQIKSTKDLIQSLQNKLH